MDYESTIYVAGAPNLLASALVRLLRAEGYPSVVGDDDDAPDAADAAALDEFFSHTRPRYVFHAAGRSGGIGANRTRPAELCRDNLSVNLNLMHAAHRHGVERLLYIASSCCYPRLAPQPLRPESLWSGPLEPTNQAYAAAKLAGIALCRAYRQQYGCDFIVGIATNHFGPGDTFDPDEAHVIAALIARMHAARQNDEPSIAVWGSGRPRREFLYVDDLAAAALHVMRQHEGIELINLSGGASLSIAELAERIRGVVGYQGELEFDTSRPDGMPLKALDPTELFALGWRPRTSFDQGLIATYEWYLNHVQTPEPAYA